MSDHAWLVRAGESMRYDWLHAWLSRRCRHTPLSSQNAMQTSYTDHEIRSFAVTEDGVAALHADRSGKLRRTASRNGDTYHDIDPVGIFMQLTTAA